MVQAIYPGFSRMSILAHISTNNPTYHGMVPRKKPKINLHLKKKKKRAVNEWIIKRVMP